MRRLASFAVLGLLACEGEVIDAPGRGPGSVGPADTGSGGAATQATPFLLATTSMRRLTVPEYTHSLQSLLGAGVTVPPGLEGIDRQGYDFTTIGAGQATFSETGLEVYQDTAFDAVQALFADSTRRSALLGACNAPTDATDACIAKFLSGFGRRAFRRPLTADELGRYEALVSGIAADFDALTGLQYAVAAFLGSPAFLYRAELGVAAPLYTGAPGPAVAFQGYELASRLSFLVWQGPPDDALLDAAGAGTLSTAAGFDAQLSRLLADPKARPALLTFFSEHLQLDLLDTLVKDADVFPAFTPTLAASMQQELLRSVEALVFDADTDLRDLFTTRTTYVDAQLSSLYGLNATPGPGFVKTAFPTDGDRAGLMGFSGILSAEAHATVTSPTERGKFIRERLLGQAIAPPPANVDVTAFQMMDTTTPRTMRERLASHATSASCAACHTLMDPPGLGLEHFDGLGQYRLTDNGLTLDTAETLDGKPFDGPAQLGSLLAADPRVTKTLVKELYQYCVGHRATAGEAPLVDSLTAGFGANGYRVLPLLRALVHSDGFLYAAPSSN